MNHGGWHGRGQMNLGEMSEAQQRMESTLDQSRSQMMTEGCLQRNYNQRGPLGQMNRGGRGRETGFQEGQNSAEVTSNNDIQGDHQLGNHGEDGSEQLGIGSRLTNIAFEENQNFEGNSEYNLPGSYPQGGNVNQAQRTSEAHFPTPAEDEALKASEGEGRIQFRKTKMRRKRRQWHNREEMPTMESLPVKEGKFIYKATYFPEYLDYVENVVKKKKRLPENEFARHMVRLNATIALESLVSSLELAGGKLLTVEHFRTHIGNHKNINAVCYFARFLHPKDATVRIIECQLYLNNVLITKHRIQIARCSRVDVIESEWLRSRDYHRSTNEAFVKAWHTLKSKNAKTIVETHKILTEGQYPDCAFSQVVIGMGKHGNSNISQLLRARHPNKPQKKWRYEDFVLIEQGTSESNKNTSMQNLTRSASWCGILVEWKYTLKHSGQTHTTVCSIYLENELVAEAWDTTRESARLKAADVAVLKLKRTHPIIVMFPKTKVQDVKTWEELMTEADAWFGQNASEVNFPLLDAEIDVEIANMLEREAKAFDDDDVLDSDAGNVGDDNTDGHNQKEMDADNSQRNYSAEGYENVPDHSNVDMDLEENTNTGLNLYCPKGNSAFNNTNPSVQPSSFQAPFMNPTNFQTPGTSSINVNNPGYHSMTTGPYVTPGGMSMSAPPPPPPPPPTHSVYPTSDTSYYTAAAGAVGGMSSMYGAQNANVPQQKTAPDNYWIYNGQYYSYDEYGYCYLADSQPPSAANNAWGPAASTGNTDFYPPGNDMYGAVTQTGALGGYGQYTANSWPPTPQHTNTWPVTYETQVKPGTSRAITKAPKPSTSPIDTAITQIAQKIAASENRKEVLEKKLKNISEQKKSNEPSVIKGRLLSDMPVEETGLFEHTKEPLLPLNKKAVLYIMHLVEEHVAKESLEELLICSNVPLAERQALNLLFPKHDCKLFFSRKKDASVLSALRWMSGQEMKDILKRHKNAIGRTVLISEGQFAQANQ